MPRGRSYQSNFTMGQMSDDMLGRVDLTAYAAGLKRAENVLPAVTGPARRRSGFLDEGAPKHHDRLFRGIPFQRSLSDRLTLEFGDFYVRFRRPNGAPVLSGGVPYEIASPYGQADLVGLDYLVSNDVVYLVHGSGTIRPKALQRRAETDWVFVDLENVDGPWRKENVDDAFTIAADGSMGAVTLTASKPLFQPGHVGSLFRLRQQSAGASVAAWAVEFDLAVEFEAAVSDGRVYSSVGGSASNSKCGTNPPVHELGVANDGRIDWTFVHDGAGVVRITSVTSSTIADAEVLVTLPTSGVASGGRRVLNPAVSYPFEPSPYWSEAAWSDFRGWPRTVADTDEERLAFGGTLVEPGMLALTRSAGYTADRLDFHPGQGTGRVVDDDGIVRTIAAGGDPILWLIMTSYLLVGTSSREYVFLGETLDDPLSPSGARAKRLTATGSRQVKPVAAFDTVIFVPRGGRGLNSLRLSADQVLEEEDLALFAEDVVLGRVAGLAWAPHPSSVCWAWTDAGELLSLVFNPRQKVYGWQRHPLPGNFHVENAWVLHDDDGYDTLWLAVAREKDGAPQRRIWRQAQRWRKADPTTSIIYLDGAKIYSGAPAEVLGGLAHLAGEEVRIFGDGGRVVESATVALDGTVAVSSPVANAVIGLRYLSAAEIMPLDVAGPAGTIGQLQRVTDVIVQVADFVEGSVAFGDGAPEPIGGLNWAGVTAPQTAVRSGKVGGKTDRAATVTVTMSDAWPGTILSVAAKVTADD